jgi:hypothetical protein
VNTWRCFHCDEVFTDAVEAREHFGADETKDAACRLGVSYVKRLRELEADHDMWRRRALHAEEIAEGLEQSHADTMRLTNGHSVFMTLDYLEGEKIVLQERIRELSQKQVAQLGGAGEPIARELFAALHSLLLMITVGWIPPDDVDDYKPDGAWQLACRAFLDSDAYERARAVFHRAETLFAEPPPREFSRELASYTTPDGAQVKEFDFPHRRNRVRGWWRRLRWHWYRLWLDPSHPSACVSEPPNWWA